MCKIKKTIARANRVYNGKECDLIVDYLDVLRTLAAGELYNTFTEKRNELFIVEWQNDPQPKERVKSEIIYILNKFLPESYDREIF